MPYISKKDRSALALRNPQNAGELNYLLTLLILSKNEDLKEEIEFQINTYIENKGLRYQNCNDVFGALVGCGLELRRRFGDTYNIEIDILYRVLHTFYDELVGPYEEEKIRDNGDLEY